ncbi:hypothetical protein NMG60_11014161 [Bertholletia excelsa]
MAANLGFLGSGGVGSSAELLSTVSKEENLALSPEVSSSFRGGSELELGLGLSLGVGLESKPDQTSDPAPWGRYARILTAKDFPSVAPKCSSSNCPSSLSSSSSSSPMSRGNLSAGTKRAADSVSPPANGQSQVVGWPPIRSYRMNSLVNQTKSASTEECDSSLVKTNSKSSMLDLRSGGSDEKQNNVKEKGQLKASLFVKVNMDGVPIGRKVDLGAHNCYETLAHTLEDMFCRTTTGRAGGTSIEEHNAMTEVTGPSKLFNGSSDLLLTYEDKEGDWMLVGDVPWGMFVSSVKRLRIMRTSEANGIGPSSQQRNVRRSKPI